MQCTEGRGVVMSVCYTLTQSTVKAGWPGHKTEAGAMAMWMRISLRPNRGQQVGLKRRANWFLGVRMAKEGVG